ncbi:MAG: lysophospholipase [Dermatophilaceae bacterium]
MSTDFSLGGHAGALAARRWDPTREPRYVAVIVHGYGEHLGRYEHVAARLVEDGAVVYALDHVGHGRSEGERVLIGDLEKVVDDLRVLERLAHGEHPALPVAMVGHSMGGTIATRYAQRYAADLACVVLSAPAIGEWAALDALLAAEQIPDVPIDPDVLSRDPAVGAAYAADPLVWHGPFKRPTLLALRAALEAIRSGPAFEGLPVLWLHGTDDQLVPYEGTAKGWNTLAGAGDEASTYRGARHEIFNETNRREVLSDVVAFIGRQLTPRAPAPKRRRKRS